LTNDQTSPVNSNVSPKVQSVGISVNGTVVAQRNSNDEFFVTFSSSLAGEPTQIGNDFIVTNEATEKELVLGEGFDAVIANGNQVKITVKGATATNKQPVTVQVRKGAKYLKAAGTNGPLVAESDKYTVVASSTSSNSDVSGTAAYAAATNATFAKVNENGLSFTASKAGAAGNVTVALEVVAPATGIEKVQFSADGKKITITTDATVTDIVNAAEAKAADLPYSIVGGAGNLPAVVGTTDYKLEGGADAKQATVTVQLSKAASGVVNQVAITNSEATKNYSAELQFANGATTSQVLVVKLGSDTIKAGSTLSGKLIVNNEQVNLTTDAITIN
jgi:hypothetical protein